ncbi:hypothetical protein SAMD00079811_09240 [Scytonema sp. HK-05]|nr:hypothetical protein SAMD00079811_09240 [Scytonema sp. HK-05]
MYRCVLNLGTSKLKNIQFFLVGSGSLARPKFRAGRMPTPQNMYII